MNRVATLSELALECRYSDAAKLTKYIRIDTTLDRNKNPRALPPELQRDVKHIRTDFDCFSTDECDALIQHGFSVAADVLGGPEGQEYSPDSTDHRWAGIDLRSSSSLRLRLWSPRDGASWAALTLIALAMLVLATVAVQAFVRALQPSTLAITSDTARIELLVKDGAVIYLPPALSLTATNTGPRAVRIWRYRTRLMSEGETLSELGDAEVDAGSGPALNAGDTWNFGQTLLPSYPASFLSALERAKNPAITIRVEAADERMDRVVATIEVPTRLSTVASLRR